jgi:hypothetical protein
MKHAKTALVILLIPLAVIAILALQIRSEFKGQDKRLNQLIEHSARTFETLDGRLGVESQVATLKLEELGRLYPALLQEIKQLRIKPQRLVQATQTTVHTEAQIHTTLRDSIVYDTTPVRLFEYHDPYVHIQGMAIEDTQFLQVVTRDTLVQALYRGKRPKPLLWIFSRRRIEQRIALKNPNAHLEYPQTVLIKSR